VTIQPSAEVLDSRMDDRVAAGVCVAFCALAWVLARQHQVPDFGVETDFVAHYAPQARNLLAGNGYTYQHNPPGYALILAATSLLTGGDFFVAGKILSVLAAALLGWVSYLLLRALFDARVALAAMLLILAAMVPYSFLAATDGVGAVLMIVPLWLILRRRDPGALTCLLAGAATGLAYLVRANALFLLPGLTLALFLDQDRPRNLRRAVSGAGFVMGGFFLIAVPWLLANWHMNGSPTTSTAYLQIAAHFYAATGDAYGTSLTQAGARFHSLSDVVRTDPHRVIGMYLRDVLLRNPVRLAQEVVQFPGYLFVGAGILWLLSVHTRRRLAFLVVGLLGYLLLGLVGFYARYYLFLLPMLFAGVAYALFGERPTNRTRSGLGWAVCLAIAAMLGKLGYDRSTWVIQHEPRYLVEMAAALKKQASPNDGVITLTAQLPYLAGLRAEFPLAERPDEYRAKAREVRARYIVYSDQAAEVWAPLKFLADPTKAPSGFRLVLKHDPSHTLVYEITP
jgi:4-amino-4-deoxy-L-arabinose transferase-like glycosyltransferase